MSTSQLPRHVGRQAFGGNPAGYHGSRPEYPDWVYTTLTSACTLGRDTAVVEIGAGTGTATHRLLELGAAPLIAIEPDPRLASFLRAQHRDETLQVLIAPFEDVSLETEAFDLAVSATAFHWLEENLALLKIARLLRPGAWWAAFWNVFGDPSRPDPFHEATQELLGPRTSPSAGERGIPFGLDCEARLAALKATGAFDLAESRINRWSVVLDAEQTVALYATYPSVTSRPDSARVLQEIGRIARDVFANRVSRNMVTSLYIARRKG